MDSAFRVPVSHLLRAPGSSRRVDVEGCLDGVSTPLGGVAPDAPIRAQGRLDGLFEGVWFDGAVLGRYQLECVRCLATVDLAFELPVAELFSAGLDPGSDEGYPLRGEEIDLAPMVRDAVILGIPAHPLCRLDCAGLCSHCGAELNDGPCGCPPEEGHPALASLVELFSSDR